MAEDDSNKMARRTKPDVEDHDLEETETMIYTLSHPSREPKAFVRSSSMQPKRESVRISMPAPAFKELGKKIAFAAAILVALSLGLFASNIYFGKKILNFKEKLSTLQEQLGTCTEGEERSLHELAGCVQDFNAISAANLPQGLTPEDFLVAKKRRKKEAVSDALATKQNEILTRLQSIKKRTSVPRNSWKKLQDEITELRSLSVKAQKAEREYKAALAASTTPSDDTPDSELTDRNKKRAAYLSEVRKTR